MSEFTRALCSGAFFGLVLRWPMRWYAFARRSLSFGGDPGLPPSPSTTPPLLSLKAFGLSSASRIVRARGCFGAFLLSTLHLLQELPPAPAQALFPLPVPFPGCFQRVPSAKGSRARSRVALRVTHVAVMACNFLIFWQQRPTFAESSRAAEPKPGQSDNLQS